MKQKLLFLCSFLVCFVAYNQTLCSSGFAGSYPCQNYDLLANLPVNILANSLGNPEGADVWGWKSSKNQKEYAIAAMTNSTAFVDVTDPLNPIFLGRLDTENGNTSFWRDVKIYGNYAFIVADNVGSHGMQVFNLDKLNGITSPQNFTADAVFTGVGSCHNIVINESTAVAYLVGCNTFSGGPHFVDISSPLNPTSLGGYSLEGYTHDAQVVTYAGPDTDYTGREIFIGSNEDKVVILDVTDKNNVTKIADITYPFIGYTHQGWFTEDHRFFIVGDETDEQDFGLNTRTLVFNFEDLDNPSLSSTYQGATNAIDHNGYVKGNEFFMASYRAGMRVFDITNIAAATNSMTEVGYFDTYPENDGTAFNGAWSIYPYLPSGNILINDIDRGLFIVRKSGTLSVPDELFESSFSIYPNPARKNPTLKAGNNSTIHSVEVFNVLGKKVFSKQNIQKQEFVLPIENEAKGIYIVKINGELSKKLILR